MLTDDFGNNITLCPPDTNLTVYVERLQPLPGSIVLASGTNDTNTIRTAMACMRM